MTETPLFPVRLTAAQRAALAAVAAEVVPDSALPPQAGHNASRVATMLRMIADGRLIVTQAQQQEVQP